MEYIYQFITFAGIVLAAWFVATDKNRNEIFKSKLVAYQELNKLLADTFSLSICVKTNKEGFEEQYLLCRDKLFRWSFEKSMITSNEVGSSIAEFLGHPQENTEEQRLSFNKATKIMSKDLNLNRLEAITKISCLQYSESQKKHKKKAKNLL